MSSNLIYDISLFSNYNDLNLACINGMCISVDLNHYLFCSYTKHYTTQILQINLDGSNPIVIFQSLILSGIRYYYYCICLTIDKQHYLLGSNLYIFIVDLNFSNPKIFFNGSDIIFGICAKNDNTGYIATNINSLLDISLDGSSFSIFYTGNNWIYALCNYNNGYFIATDNDYLIKIDNNGENATIITKIQTYGLSGGNINSILQRKNTNDILIGSYFFPTIFILKDNTPVNNKNTNLKSNTPKVFMCMTKGQDINSYCDNLSQSRVLYNKLATGGNDPTITQSMRFSSLANSGTYKTITKSIQYDYNIPNPPQNLSATGNVSSKSLSVWFTAPNKLITYTIQIYDNYGNLIKQVNTNKTSYLFNNNIIFYNNNNTNTIMDISNNGYSVAVSANINNGIYLGNTYQVNSDDITTINNSDNSIYINYTYTPPIQEQPEISYYTLTLFDSNGKIIQKINTNQTNYTFKDISAGKYYIYATATNNNGTSTKYSSIEIVF